MVDILAQKSWHEANLHPPYISSRANHIMTRDWKRATWLTRGRSVWSLVARTEIDKMCLFWIKGAMIVSFKTNIKQISVIQLLCEFCCLEIEIEIHV